MPVLPGRRDSRCEGPGATWRLRSLLTGRVYVTLIICPLTNVHGWTGGWSPAASFLTPITPLLGLFVFAGLLACRACVNCYRRAADRHQRLCVAAPEMLWNDGDGRAAFCEQLGDRVCDRLPSFVTDDDLPPEGGSHESASDRSA